MADKTNEKLEREYVIPLRKEWRKVANYRRTGRAIKEIKKFIARHMKVPERNTENVKIDSYLNQEIWFRGKTKPPAKIKVRAVKEGDKVLVYLLEMPSELKFRKIKQDRLMLKLRPRAEESKKTEDKKKIEEKTEEEKKEEVEKEKSVAEFKEKEIKKDAKAKKHTTKVKEPQYHRMALQK